MATETPANSDSLICCPLTPPGVGAIAVVAMRGAQSWQTIRSCVEGPKGSLPDTPQSGRLYFGIFGDEHETIDEVVVAPQHDASGVPIGVDISAHGGIRVVERILMTLTARGATLVSNDKIAFFGNRPTSAREVIRTDAMRRLMRTTTRRAARFLMAQSEALPNAYDKIIALSESGHESAARAELKRLIDRSQSAKHLLMPPKISIIGPPNAGKSSLVNALSGRGDVIVSDTEGTTRDWVTVPAVIDGVEMTLIDTAGLREAPTTLEEIAIERGRSAAKDSDLRIWVFDQSVATLAELHATAAAISEHDILTANKSELPRASVWQEFIGETTTPVIEISATDRSGMGQLRSAILMKLGLNTLDETLPTEFDADRLRILCDGYRTNSDSGTSLAQEIKRLFVR